MDLTPSTYSLLSVNYTIKEDGDPRGPLLNMYIEIRNDGFELDCNFLPEISLSGMEVLGLMETPPYRELSDFVEYSTLANCFGPGEIGVIIGAARGITQEDLDASGYLF